MAIFTLLPLGDLLTLRLCSGRFKALSEFLLSDVLQKLLSEQKKARKGAEGGLRELEREKRPRMVHYRCVTRTAPRCWISQLTLAGISMTSI
jgi:hypothetical protein